MHFEQIDFVSILIQRIRIIRALTLPRHREELRSLKKYGEAVYKEALQDPYAIVLAVIFCLAGSEHLDVWIDPDLKSSCKDPDSMHYELYLSLGKHLESLTGKQPEFSGILHRGYVSGAVYCYANGMKLLSLESLNYSPMIPEKLLSEVCRETPLAAKLSQMMVRYNFNGIYGPTGLDWLFRGRKSDLEEDGYIIIPPPSLDKLRQDRYLWLIAKRHGLSCTDYLRFRCLALSAHTARISWDYDSIIREMRD